MNYEGIPEQQNHIEGKEHLPTPAEVREQIAKTLIGYMCSPEDGEDCIDKWWEDNAEVFVEAFDQALQEHPNIAEFWNKDHDQALEFFNGKLLNSKHTKRS